MKKLNHPLMDNNIEDTDVDALRKFLNSNKKKNIYPIFSSKII